MLERSEHLVCRFCGGEFADMRGQLPGLEDPPPEFCPSCERGTFVVEEAGWFGLNVKRGDRLVIRDIEPRGSMNPITIDEVRQALGDAFNEDAGDARVDTRPVVRPARPAQRLPAPTMEEAIGAVEEVEYRQFASLLGLETDDEPSTRRVTVTVAQHEEWMCQTEMLDELNARAPGVYLRRRAGRVRAVPRANRAPVTWRS